MRIVASERGTLCSSVHLNPPFDELRIDRWDRLISHSQSKRRVISWFRLATLRRFRMVQDMICGALSGRSYRTNQSCWVGCAVGRVGIFTDRNAAHSLFISIAGNLNIVLRHITSQDIFRHSPAPTRVIICLARQVGTDTDVDQQVQFPWDSCIPDKEYGLAPCTRLRSSIYFHYQRGRSLRAAG